MFDYWLLETRNVEAFARNYARSIDNLKTQKTLTRRDKQKNLATQRGRLSNFLSGNYFIYSGKSALWKFQHYPKEEDMKDAFRQKVSVCESINYYQHDLVNPSLSPLPHSGWLALGVEFTLQRPWYSKDDTPFHVMDNPLRKDRVFAVPFMSPSGWKGLLRWACRMTAGLSEYLAQHNNTLHGWQDPDWILHLFGNEKPKGTEAHSHFHQGCLCFYPTWFDRIGFEVINPHNRATRAGTQPIHYEVVPPGTKGHLCLLYAPPPGVEPWPKGVKPHDALCRLIDAIEWLLTTWGISAKRTAGWGTARVDWWAVRKGSEQSKTRLNMDEIKACIREHYTQEKQ